MPTDKKNSFFSRYDSENEKLEDELRLRFAELAVELKGRPTSKRSADVLCWGNHQSFDVNLRKCEWYDREAGEGGGPVQLIMYVRNCDHREALEWAREWVGVDRPTVKISDIAMSAESEERPYDFKDIVDEIVPIAGTPGEAYLRRKLRVDELRVPDCIGYLDGAVVARATNANGVVEAVQLVHVPKDDEEKARKLTYNRVDAWAERSAVRLPGEGPIVLAEGVATALAIWEATGRETWCTLGVSNMGKLKLSCRSLIIARDHDEPGAAADKAIARAVEAHRSRGALVAVACPEKEGDDFADVISTKGVGAVQVVIDAAAEKLCDAEAIDELARLDKVEYGKRRGDAARAMGVKLSVLDAAVRERAEEVEDASGGTHDDDAADMDEFNAKFATVNLGGTTVVMTMKEDIVHPGFLEPSYQTPDNFKSLKLNRKKVIINDAGKQQVVGIGHWWFNHRDRRTFEDIAYLPGAPHDRDVFNLWQGFSCEPKAGDCSLFLDHVKNVWCGGNEEYYEYTIKWMARIFQVPHEQGRVAIVLRGKEGVGKGVVVKYLGQLLGPHFIPVSQTNQVVGTFNPHLERCSLLFADEAFFAADPKNDGHLKYLITEDFLMIHPKNVNPYVRRNLIHLIMATNDDWAVPAGPNARRYCVFNVSDARMGDRAYFDAIVKQMEREGVLAALLHHLVNVDLTGFRVEDFPRTEALREQQAYSRRGVDRLMEELLSDGALPNAYAVDPSVVLTTERKTEDRDVVPSFYDVIKKLVPDLRYLSNPTIRRTLEREWGCDGKWRKSTFRGIKFPPLPRARAAFVAKYGDQGWDTEEDWGDDDGDPFERGLEGKKPAFKDFN